MPSTRTTGSQLTPLETLRVHTLNDEHDNGFLARTYPLFLFITVFVLILAVVV